MGSGQRAGGGLPALGPRGEGWVIAQLGLLALLAVVGLPGLATIGVTSIAGWGSFALGAALMAGAAAIFIAAVRSLGRSLTPTPRPRDDAVLVEAGAYRVVRHPIYASLILGSIGWSLVTHSLAAVGVTAVLAALLDLKSRREEAWLGERYPAYAAYRRRTRRFVPGVY